jgi:hypothetical protein
MSTLLSRLPRSLSASHDAWCLSISMISLWMWLHSFRVKICYPFELLILRTLSIYKHSSRRDDIHSADSRNEFCVRFDLHSLIRKSLNQMFQEPECNGIRHAFQWFVDPIRSTWKQCTRWKLSQWYELACLSFVWVKVNGWTNLSSCLLILCSSNKSCMRSGIRRCLSIGIISDFDKNGNPRWIGNSTRHFKRADIYWIWCLGSILVSLYLALVLVASSNEKNTTRVK